MVSLRIFATARPSQIGARVLPIDPAEQAALDELRRRRHQAAAQPKETRHG